MTTRLMALLAAMLLAACATAPQSPSVDAQTSPLGDSLRGRLAD